MSGRRLRVLAVAQSSLHSGAEDVFGAVIAGLAAAPDLDLTVALPPASTALTAQVRADPRLALLSAPALTTRAPALRAFRPDHLRAVRRLLHVAGADVVLVNLPSAEHGGALLRLAAAPTVGLVHVPHTPAAMGAKLGRLRTALTRRGTRRATLLCTLSPQGGELARAAWAGPETGIARFRLPPRTPAVVDRAAARAALNWPRDAVVVGLAGRIAIGQKGHDVLLAAAERLVGVAADGADAVPALRIAIAGDGPDADAVHADVRARRLDDVVDFCGHVDIAGFLAAVDVLAMPSAYEGVPLVALEALALRRPGVATAIAGLGEVWPAAWQVPVGDAAALADAIRAVLATPAPQARALLDAAARDAASFTAADPSLDVADALRRVAGRPLPPADA